MLVDRQTIGSPQSIISVQFCDMIDSKEQLANQIQKLNNPQVITWFLGRKGLREDWLSYCNGTLIDTVRKVSAFQKFYLYDLRNWASIKNKSTDKTKPRGSKVIKRIKSLNCSEIVCLDSAEYFKFLKECGSVYIKEILSKREFIWLKSASFKPAGVSIQDLFSAYPVLQGIGDIDVNNAYSALQYLEGYFLIEEIVKRCTSSGSERIEIVFLLPNDEDRYYFDEQNSFEKDVQELLQRKGLLAANKKVEILFIPFKWTEDLSKRPYLSDGKSVKGEGLKLLDSLKG